MILNNYSLKNEQKTPKELISYLLNKYLGERIDKLEQNNLKNELILRDVKETSNKMEKFLEDSSEKSKYTPYKY